MNESPVTADELLAGANATYRLEVPAEVVRPGAEGENKPVVIQLRPVTIGGFQLILKAAKDDPGMIPILLIKESLVEPEMNLQQVQRLHLGLVEYLVNHIRKISGMDEKKNG
ncbi:MAG TPA: hypothetical protein ENJ82_04205 [Bacteroidetes bacterium]|nr:hypothetical protein [Bacteroidota bacterium]